MCVIHRNGGSICKKYNIELLKSSDLVRQYTHTLTYIDKLARPRNIPLLNLFGHLLTLGRLTKLKWTNMACKPAMVLTRLLRHSTLQTELSYHMKDYSIVHLKQCYSLPFTRQTGTS